MTVQRVSNRLHRQKEFTLSLDLIAPHGGLTEPVDRMVPAAEQSAFVAAAEELPSLRVSDADLSMLYRFGDGGLSPLSGPMNGDAWNRVLDAEHIVHNGKKYAWTIPLSFPVDKDERSALKVGGKAALRNE